ncbi:MAG: glycine/sarcosine/betaine reductase selenoprotein B family protein [Dehalococcoidia bacterium]
MATKYREWILTESEQQKFTSWMSNILVGHTGTQDVRNDTVNFAPLNKPLSECLVSLFTTGGVHLKSDEPFDIIDAHGDPSYREIPTDVSVNDLTITHSHYSHVDADQDVNCMFPLDRLRELADQGIIGGVAAKAYAIMGFNPDPSNLMARTAPALAQGFKEAGADLVFMTCG